MRALWYWRGEHIDALGSEVPAFVREVEVDFSGWVFAFVWDRALWGLAWGCGSTRLWKVGLHGGLDSKLDG